uniref:non-specific serine/threonine protein kinase n=1 Tax=Haemonchus contortus TaxID=6289 RepID=A0A7I5EBE5_HAECO
MLMNKQIKSMMVARVKADDRVVRSEPPTYVSIHEESEHSEVEEQEEEPKGKVGKFKETRRSHDEAPTHKPRYPREDTFTRTVSSQSLLNNDRLEELAQMSLYDRTLHMLAVDPMYQKEVALGKRIGFYRLGKELGAGNFSKVKLGIHVLTKEKVAVKIMDRTKMDTKAQRLLEREIKAMERMHHPNIIRLFECVETLTRTHLVLEYAGGGELYAYVHERGKLSEHEAKPLFAQIVAAVSHMHKNNLVHRDIKAENIMFSAPGVVKLVDFGFSCMLPSAAEQLKTFCGSPPYAAPELFRDESYNGPKVDIWALGVLLHFMLIGVTPFRGETVPELKSVILQGSFTLPLYLEHSSRMLIESMLSMDPYKRPKIDDIRRSIWLRGSQFPSTYLNLRTCEEDENEKKSEISKKVWAIMNSYGITEQMLEESNELGPRNSLIGTYRIVQYQVQTAPKEPKPEFSLPQSSTNAAHRKMMQRQLKNKSKTCVIV